MTKFSLLGELILYDTLCLNLAAMFTQLAQR